MPKISWRTAACVDKWSELNAKKNPYKSLQQNEQGTCHQMKSPNSTKPWGFFWPNTAGKLHLAKHDCSRALPKAKAPTMVKRTSRWNGWLSTKNADETCWKKICLENHPQYGMVDLSFSYLNSMSLHGHLESGWHMEAQHDWTNTDTVKAVF